MFGQIEVNVEENNNSATISLTKEESDSSKIKKERLEDIVEYNSEDQIHERENQRSYLLRKAVVKYIDMNIEADYIEINWKTGDVFADGKKDSLGLVIEPTIFRQGEQVFEQDAFLFNFNTQKGTAYNVRFDDPSSEGVMLGEKVYRVNDSISYASKLKYTTDTYFKEKKTNEPDYVIQAEEGKILDQNNNKVVIARDIILKIHDVPTPFVLPFIYLPLSDKRKAGILIPSFGEREELGFFLTGGGFYLPIGEHIDLAITSDIYTRGSWGIHAQSTYRKRYKFNGKFQFDYENQLTGTKGLNDFSEQTIFRLNWSHTQDPKSNPSLVFTSNVNYASSQFFRSSINNQNVFNNSFLTNNIASTISLNKTFDDSPFSASLTMSLNQLNNTRSDEPASVSLNLPQLTVNMSRIYPFAKKEESKKGLIKNFNATYTMNFQNFFDTNENDLFTSRMWDQARNGIQHRASFTTGITLANYFPINFSANYEEVWYTETIDYIENEEGIFERQEISGFDAFRTFGFSMNTQTNFYGTYIAKNEDSFIQGIRHVINPTVGFSFRPDFAAEFWGYYDFFREEDGTRMLFNRFQEGIYGGPSQGLNTSLTFAVNNNLEMKIRDSKDSTGYKKIKIFDFLDFNSSYNFAADSMMLTPIIIRGATRLFNDELSVNFGAVLNPYEVIFDNPTSPVGRRVDNFDLGLDSYSVQLSYAFNNRTFGEELDPTKYTTRGTVRQEDYYFDKEKYAKFSIPWNVNIGVNHTYNLGTSRTATRQLSARLSGSVQPSPHWRIQANTNYDFERKDFSATNFSFQRDLRSFNLTFSWQPFGQFRAWDFFINIKSSILSDAVKYDENSSNELRGLFN